MKESSLSIPLEIQLEVICAPRPKELYNLIASYLSQPESFDILSMSEESYKDRIKNHLTFKPSDLIKYFKDNPTKCNNLLNASYDKRYSPSTFIEEWENNQYRVGWVKSAGEPLITQIHVFNSFADAVADYVLFSWGFPRLTKEESNWYESDHFWIFKLTITVSSQECPLFLDNSSDYQQLYQ